MSGPISFELIPHDDWFQPDWIDENKATQNRNKLVADRIIYGGEHLINSISLTMTHTEFYRQRIVRYG